MSEYQKKFNVPMPIDNFDKKMQNWIEKVFGVDTLNRYVQLYNLHESIVKEADTQGDRVVFFHKQGEQSYVEIHWRSEEVHMMYMNRISLEDRLFYERMWTEFHAYLGTGYKC